MACARAAEDSVRRRTCSCLAMPRPARRRASMAPASSLAHATPPGVAGGVASWRAGPPFGQARAAPTASPTSVSSLSMRPIPRRTRSGSTDTSAWRMTIMDAPFSAVSGTSVMNVTVTSGSSSDAALGPVHALRREDSWERIPERCTPEPDPAARWREGDSGRVCASLGRGGWPRGLPAAACAWAKELKCVREAASHGPPEGLALAAPMLPWRAR
mmetsp:Transcript_1852/g.7320  ORF Transcript_1852/g.7320 Transcript_1852/m.7320 type:complete len:215 (-) Transcript_1852:625-1269(-)